MWLAGASLSLMFLKRLATSFIWALDTWLLSKFLAIDTPPMANGLELRFVRMSIERDLYAGEKLFVVFGSRFEWRAVEPYPEYWCISLTSLILSAIVYLLNAMSVTMVSAKGMPALCYWRWAIFILISVGGLFSMFVIVFYCKELAAKLVLNLEFGSNIWICFLNCVTLNL